MLICYECGGTVTERVGTLKNARHLIRGRRITVRGLILRRCQRCHGREEGYTAMGPMLELLLAHPRKRVVTWHPKMGRWT